MVQPIPIIVESLTGNTRMRPAWFWRKVKQVEVHRTSYHAFDFDRKQPLHTWTAWRDAVWEDFVQVTLDPQIRIDSPSDHQKIVEAIKMQTANAMAFRQAAL